MKLRLKLLTYIQLLFIAVFIFSFNISVVHAEKFELGPFKGKLTGTLVFITNSSYQNYKLKLINLSNGKIITINNFKNTLGKMLLGEPEISTDHPYILLTAIPVKNQNYASKILKVDLKSKKLVPWLFSKLDYANPRYSQNSQQVAVSQTYNTDFSKNIIIDLKTEKLIELPCPEPRQCVMPDWNNNDKKIVFLNDLGRKLNEINIKSNKIATLYSVKNNNYFTSYPSYTNNGNIIFTEILKPKDNIEKTTIKILNDKSSNIYEIYTENEYIAAAITLNNDRFIAFVTDLYLEQSKLTIYDRKTKNKIVYKKSLRSISTPVWRP